MNKEGSVIILYESDRYCRYEATSSADIQVWVEHLYAKNREEPLAAFYVEGKGDVYEIIADFWAEEDEAREIELEREERRTFERLKKKYDKEL